MSRAITLAELNQIIDCVRAGESHAAIAERFGRGITTIGKIAKIGRAKC